MPTTIVNHSLASKQFVTAVAEFEKANKKKIAEFLSSSLPEHQALIEEFFTHPIIYNYLSRKADTVHFLNNKPADSCLTPIEVKIYKLRPDLFSFRDETDNDRFYLDGARKSTNFYLSLQNRYNHENLSITSAMDIYEIREHLDRCLSNKIDRLERFILTPNWKDGHATCMVHIVNPESRRVMASVFINSWQRQDYVSYLSYRFNLDAIQAVEYKKEINPSDVTRRKIPFIDASHQIQVLNEDSNCTLYGYNFIEATANLLGEPSITKRIFELAEAVDKGELQASNELQSIFAEELKNYLPCYYENKKNKIPADIKEFHLQQRWNIGSEIFSYIYSPKPMVQEIIPEPERVKTFKTIFSNQENSSSLAYVGKDKVTQYVFDHILSVLEKEKTRLIKKYPPVKNANPYSDMKETKIDRIAVLETLTHQIYEELANFEENPQANTVDLKKSLESIISTQLNSKVLDKYQSWGEKLALTLCNILLSLPVIGLPIKKLITGAWFFSLEGKTVESSKMALQELDELPMARH
jgi:hypothetical protein